MARDSHDFRADGELAELFDALVDRVDVRDKVGRRRGHRHARRFQLVNHLDSTRLDFLNRPQATH
eukprot:7390118-Prymnesium_polylepis.1